MKDGEGKLYPLKPEVNHVYEDNNLIFDIKKVVVNQDIQDFQEELNNNVISAFDGNLEVFNKDVKV